MKLRTTILWLLCAWAAASVAAPATPAWPRVTLPSEAQSFALGAPITMNGVPMQVSGFVSHTSPAQTADWFRHSLGEPLVESKLGDKLILGRAEGEFYLTVQLERAGGGTRGLVGITHLKAAAMQAEQTRQTRERWQSRLPAGSRILTQTSSVDGTRVSNLVAFSNGLGPDLNRDRLEAMLRDDGLHLEREARADDDAAAQPALRPGSRLLLFKGDSRSATAVITRGAKGDTSVVLNLNTELELAR